MLLEQAALALLDYIETATDGFRILVRDSPVRPVHRHLRQPASATSPARSSTCSADEFRARDLDPKTAPLYAQMLVGMVALTGQWWLDVRKPKKEDGRRAPGQPGLERPVRPGGQARPSLPLTRCGAGRRAPMIAPATRDRRGRDRRGGRATRSTASSPPGGASARPRRRAAGGALPGDPARPAPRPARAAAFAAHGLEPWEFDVLAALRRAGAPYQLSPGQLVAETLVTSGTMTNRIDRLEARGLVRRLPDPADGRGVLVRLTDAGRGLVDTALADLLERERIAADAGLGLQDARPPWPPCCAAWSPRSTARRSPESQP